ncbi:MAG: LamG domain-containing protein, partial [Ideonella sp.]|nr:LamG domain-containing protein [Ideonella sp.]
MIAQDATPNSNTATLTRSRWSAGRAGGALALDGGNDDIVSVPVSASLLRTREAITIAAWTWRDATHNVAIVSHGYPALFFGFHGPLFKWQIEYLGGLHASCYANRKHVAALGRWIHVAATYDGWTARLYADGKQICRTWAVGPLTMPAVPFTIGGYLDDAGRIVDEMAGLIDDVRIYARALTADEILQLAQ